MASATAVVPNPLLTLFLQAGIVHERRVRISRRILLLLRDEVAGDIFCILWAQAQAGHYRHVLHLQFVSIIRTLAVREIPLEGKAFLGVILRPDIFLLVRAIGTRALAGIVNPAHKVVVVRLLSDARQVRGEGSALQFIALAHRVAGEASARFEQLFAVCGVARLVLGQSIREARLPYVRRDRLDLMIGQAEVRHLRGRTEVGRLFQPDRNPVLVQLEPHVFQVRPDLLHVLHQAVGLEIELLQPRLELAVGDSEVDSLGIKLVGFVVRFGGIGLLHQVSLLLQIVFLLRFNLLDLLPDGVQIFWLFVVPLISMAAIAATLAKKIFAGVDGFKLHIAAGQNHVRRMAALASRLGIFLRVHGPQPVFVIAMSFFDAGGGAPIALMAGRASELVRIVNLQQLGF